VGLLFQPTPGGNAFRTKEDKDKMGHSRIPVAADCFVVPAGFLFGAAEGAIKKPGRLDVSVIQSPDKACLFSAGAVFTTNRFAAAPVIVSRHVLSSCRGMVSGVVVNSGCANAVTGARGHVDAETMASSLPAGRPALVCSTGTIGVHLPMERLLPAIRHASSSAGGDSADFLRFADAILTTDTRRKVASACVDLGSPGPNPVIVGCAKGAGMIAPSMATLLAYVCTDARIAPDILQRTLGEVAERTLNCLTVDGDTSTNDTLIALASNRTGPELRAGSPELAAFAEGLETVLRSLTIQLASDGEGATTVIEVIVSGATTEREARMAALEVANSPLVKTAVHGRDANWGRIAMALGNSGAIFDPTRVHICVGGVVLLDQGTPVPFDEAVALKALDTDYLEITCDLGAGPGLCRAWTCDFSKQYIEINGAYRT
jgi:glutamate N-acetyltransferase/amino-acid N-acetyltransferase